MDYTGLVDADHHQFCFGSVLAEPDEDAAEGSVLSVSGGACVIQTGIAYGPVAVHVAVLATSPPDDEFVEWEIVEEASIRFGDDPVAVMTLAGAVTPDLTVALDTDETYAVRVSARGRDDNWDMEVTAPTEDYLIQLWPRESQAGVRQLKKTDEVWSDEPLTTAIDADIDAEDAPFSSGFVQVFNDEGPNTFLDAGNGLPVASPGGWSVGLRDSHPGVELRKLDAALVDQILDLTEDRQKALTRWVVTRTLEMVGMSELPWVAEPLALLNRGVIYPFMMRNPLDEFKVLGGEGIEEHWVDPVGSIPRSKERIAVGLLSGCEYSAAQTGLGVLGAVYEATLAWSDETSVFLNELRQKFFTP